jgi:hypothetical protein
MTDEINDDSSDNRKEQRDAAFRQGNDWAALYGAELEKQLEWNYDREQRYGEENRFDFYANDDGGTHQFSIEVKFRQEPDPGEKEYWTGDKVQEEGLIDKTAAECDQKTLFYIVPERFLESPRLADRQEYAQEKGVTLILLPLEQVEDNVQRIKEELDRVIDEKARADATNDREPEVDRLIDNEKNDSQEPRLQDPTVDGELTQFEAPSEPAREAGFAARDGNDTTIEKDVEATDTAPLEADDQSFNDPAQGELQDGDSHSGSPDERDLIDLDVAETDIEVRNLIDDTAIEGETAIENATNSEEILAADGNLEIGPDGGEKVGDLDHDQGAGLDDLGGHADESRLADLDSGEADFSGGMEPAADVDGAGSSDLSFGIDIGPGTGKDD